MTTDKKKIWMERAAKIIATAPNDDWRKSGYVIDSEELTVPINGWDTEDREVHLGEGTGVIFNWTNREGWKGFIVAEFNGVLDSSPVMKSDPVSGSVYCVGMHISRRICPKCKSFDTLRTGRRVRSCTKKGCGHKESSI